MSEVEHAPKKVQVRCGFCLTPNRIDLTRAEQRPRCGKCEKPMLLDRPVKVGDEDFATTVLAADAPVLVDFHAEWCGPCKVLAPMVDDIASDNVGRLLVAKVDTDRAIETARTYGITSVPTLVLFQDGAEAGRTIGIMPDEIRALVERAVGPAVG